ncbi:uncharacterized protein N0V89_004851 [Didymosphaeria variabile]|uniref:Uncharacterized protein n=1 Tax=Didymosphaeria variabile TaxID=1932322 RepID=A0A9W9CCS7_9PLEO|nr:uncharacterized protein N0V89_004851 [Didymosphaeria variabile]KAJ4356814.1 hypothetical protein N0V89_004851 [Didymosphaeria variabile]
MAVDREAGVEGEVVVVEVAAAPEGGGGGGYMSSDDDDEQNAEFPRKNIDFIELSSDENEEEPAPRSHGHLPIRIGRKPHKEKTFGINTDASTEANAPQQAQASSGPATEGSHKGKGKAKEVEITGESKSYKGVWQDSDGTDGEAKVKPEPISSDDEGASREQVGIAAPIKTEHSPERERKPKVHSTAIPSFQTDEERQEWERIQYNLIGMRKELGPPEDEQQPDPSGDVPMLDAVANASKPSVRDDHTYLFQLPPIMPELLLPGQQHLKIKQEPSDAQPAPAAAPPHPASPPSKRTNRRLLRPRADTSTGARFASGRVGKMRVHASGRTTLDWGHELLDWAGESLVFSAGGG